MNLNGGEMNNLRNSSIRALSVLYKAGFSAGPSKHLHVEYLGMTTRLTW